MANRYTNLGYTSTLNMPLLQLPFKQMDALLGQYQKQKVVTDNLITKEFANLSKDQALADEVRQYQSGVKDTLKRAFQTGNTDLYMTTLKSAQEALVDLRSPSGAITALESRVKQKQERDKRIREFYKDTPEWSNYFINTTPLPDINYSSTNRTYQGISKDLPLPKYIDPADIEKRIQGAVKSLKESLLEEGEEYSERQLDEITTLHDFSTLKGITQERISEAVEGALTDEDKKSLMVQENIDRYGAGKKPNATIQDILPFDKDGNVQSNFLGNLLAHKAKANAIQNVSHKYIKDNHELDLHRAKKKIDEENNFLTGYGLVSEQHSSNSNIKSLFLTSEESGLNVILTSEEQKSLSPEDRKKYQELRRKGTIGKEEAKKNALDSFNKMKNGKYKGSHPFSDIVANALEDEFMHVLNTKGIKEARKYLSKELENYQASNVNNDFQYRVYDPASRKRENEIAFKDGDFLTKDFITVTSDNVTKTMSQAEYAESKGFDLNDPEEAIEYRNFLTKSGIALGETIGDGSNPLAPESDVYKIGNDIIRAGTGSIEEANINTPAAIIAESFNTNRPSEIASFPLVRELYNENGQPRRVQVKPKTGTKRAALIEERRALKNNIRRGTGQAVQDAGNRIMQINEQLQKMSADPSLNGLTGKNEYLLYDYDTGELLGDEKHIRQLLIINKQNGENLINQK